MMKKRLFALGMLLLPGLTHLDAQQLTLRADNIDQIVEAMTVEEKARLLCGRNDPVFRGYEDTEEPFTRIIPTNIAGYTQAIPRLGIPATALADGPVGLVIVSPPDAEIHYTATGFPSGTLMACSWDTELNETVGRAIGKETLEHGVDVILSPGMNIQRSPLGGRNYEYYSEDPLLTGKMASSLVRGIQSNGVGTSLKHFAANSQETNRTNVDEVVSQRALREIYLKGFEIAVKESQPWTVMSSYNRLNGPYTQENRELLTTVLRDEWGFDGIVMTDWIQIRNTVAQIRAGNDLMEPGYQVQIDDIVAKVNSGELPIADVDICVRRVLEYIVKTPHFKGYNFSHKHDAEAHAMLARRSAAEGMVLLKNEGETLPLKGVGKVALFGGSSYDFMAGGTGSGNVVKPYVINLHRGLTDAGLETTENLREVYEKYSEYLKLKNRFDGTTDNRSTLPEMPISRAAIEKQAAETDIAVFTIGRQAGEGGDRTVKGGYDLSSTERELLGDICDVFHAAGKRVVVVLNVGGAIETASWKGLPDAILLAWQPGQEGGNAVADVLTGKVNPSGKLSMTLSISAMDHPSSLNFPLGNTAAFRPGRAPRPNIDYTLHKEGIWVGYRYFNTAGKEVSYPFGYGLSYTDFAYGKPVVRATGDGFRATVTVTNTGQVAGRESVQLYVSAPVGGLEKPARELRSFAKTRLLQPGESETLSFEVSDYSLASFDEERSSWVSPRGRYTVGFGASVEDIRATGTYDLGREFTMQVNDVLRPNMDLN